jgi:hypothetical protein
LPEFALSGCLRGRGVLRHKFWIPLSGEEPTFPGGILKRPWRVHPEKRKARL